MLIHLHFQVIPFKRFIGRHSLVYQIPMVPQKHQNNKCSDGTKQAQSSYQCPIRHENHQGHFRGNRTRLLCFGIRVEHVGPIQSFDFGLNKVPGYPGIVDAYPDGGEKEQEEPPVGVMTNTIVEPGTVMVGSSDTKSAQRTVFGTCRANEFACTTVSRVKQDVIVGIHLHHPLEVA